MNDRRKLHLPTEGYGWYPSILMAAAGVSLATSIFWLTRNILGKDHASLLYLPVVVLVASVGGTRAGLAAAALSFLCWNFFFIPPYYTFIIEDPKDWLSLIVFLLVGLGMGIQTGRLRERESEALAREQESALLYRLGAQLASQTSTRSMTRELLDEVVRASGAAGAALFLPEGGGGLQATYTAGTPPTELERETYRLAEWSFREMKAVGLPPVTDSSQLGAVRWPVSVRLEDIYPLPDDPGTGPPGASAVSAGASAAQHAIPSPVGGGIYLPLQATTEAEGVLYISARAGKPYSPRDARLLVSISHLAAVFLERQRLQSMAAQADALREAGRPRLYL